MNGYRVGEEFWEGKKVTYKCKAGYWLNGAAEPVCNGTGYGNWSDERPFCESKSRLLGNIVSLRYQLCIM